MILSVTVTVRYRPVTVPLPSRYRLQLHVIHRQPPLPNITDVTDRPQRYLTLQALLNVTERY
jgi:hypothetical protein